MSQAASEKPSLAAAVSQSGGSPCVAPSPGRQGDLEAGVVALVCVRLMFVTWRRLLPRSLLLSVGWQLFLFLVIRLLLQMTRLLRPPRLGSSMIDLCLKVTKVSCAVLLLSHLV